MSDDESASDPPPEFSRYNVVDTAVGALHALLGTDPEADDRPSGSTDSDQETGSSDESD